MKNFLWFTAHSWSFMKGQRKRFLLGFWGAWVEFRRLHKEDKAS